MGDFARMVFDLLVISSAWMYAPNLDLLALAVVMVVLVAAVAIAVRIPAEPMALFVAPRAFARARRLRRTSRVARSLRRARAPSVEAMPSHV